MYKQPEDIKALRNVLYEEDSLYKLSIPPMGALWDRAWLPGYAQDDRSASMLLDMFSITSNNFQEMAGITAAAREYIPAMGKELGIIRRLDDEMIAPIKRTYDSMESRFENEGKYLLLPIEYSDTSYRINSLITYFDYRNGLNALRKNHFDGRDARYLLDIYGPAVKAFVRKWDGKFFIGDPKEFGFISFLGVDSHDDSNNSPIMPKILESKDPTDVIMNEIPERGIENVIFANEARIKENIRHILENREQRTKMCTVGSFKMRLEEARMSEYLKRILPGNGTGQNPFYVR